MSNITIHNFTGPTRVSGTVYGVIIDPEDQSIRDWSHVGAGVPMEVWHRRAILIPVSANAHPASLQAAVVENLDLIEDIMSAYDGTEWDGNNHVGQWQEDADDPVMRVCDVAERQLEQLFEQVPGVVDAGDWFGYSAHRLGDLMELSDVEGKTLAAIAAALIEDAEQQGDVFFSDDKQEQLEERLGQLVADELSELEEREKDEDDDLDEAEVAWLMKLRCLEAGAQAA